MVLLAVLLIYPRSGREQVVTVVVLAALWVALVLTLSRSSLGALLVGLGLLAALRWRPTRALYIALAVIVIGAVAVAAAPRTFGLNQGINGASSGRGGLVSGGIFAPNGTIEFNGNGSTANFLESKDVDLVGGGFTGDGPVDTGSGSGFTCTTALLQ